MNKHKTPTFWLAKYLLIIPVGIVFALGNAAQASSNQVELSSVPVDEKQVSPTNEADVATVQQLVEKEKIFESVEQMPQYPGGNKAMMDFIHKNLKYPKAAIKNNVTGTVYVRFIVSKDGFVKDIQIQRGLSPEINAEAIRVVSRMPKWNPGKYNGKLVDVYFTLPISFKIFNPNAEKEKLFVAAEEMPQYSGGDKAMMDFIRKNLKYPEAAIKNNVTGTVYVRFIVNKDGSIKDVKIQRGLSPETNSEAVRVVSMMPKWIPGKQKGKQVNVYFTLPITFDF